MFARRGAVAAKRRWLIATLALSARGMQGLGIRLARALNRVMGRSGRVVADRYHAHILKTPSEVTRARLHLRDNARRHDGHAAADRFASHVPVVAPRTWLLRRRPT